MAIGRPLNLTANVASKNISVLATAGQTSFTVTGGYRINEIAVYRNGTRLVDGRDFTATDGSIVTLVSAATLYDVIEYQIFDSFNVADAVGTSGDSTINGNLTISGNTTLSTLGVSIATTSKDLLVTGVSTFTGTVDANGALDVDGHTELDDVNIAGVTTIRNAIGTKLYETSVNGSKLFHAGTERLSTELYGIDINGTLGADSINCSGIVTASKLGVGNITPNAMLTIPAQASGDSGIVRLAIESQVDDNDFTISQYEDVSGTYTLIGQNCDLGTGGNEAILDSGHRTAGILLDGRNHGRIEFYTGDTNTLTKALTLDKTQNATFSSDLRVDHSNNVGSDKLLRLGNANNSGTNSAHLWTPGSYFVGPTDVDGTGYKAKIDTATGAITTAAALTFQDTYKNVIGNNGDGFIIDVDPDSTGGAGADLRVEIKGVELFRFDGGGNARFGVNSPYSAASPAINLDGTNGAAEFEGAIKANAGIDFSGAQTNAAGMTSETLDSYEEGTWTPFLTCSGDAPTVTGGSYYGRYVKIGRQVTLNFWIGAATVSDEGTGTAQIGGIPFTPPAASWNQMGSIHHVGGGFATTPDAIYAREGEAVCTMISAHGVQTALGTGTGNYYIGGTLVYQMTA